MLNNLCIELQIRTKLQHTWATAVEIASIFNNEDLKSSIGNKNWLDFFALIGSAFAHMENLPCLKQHFKIEKQEIFKQVIKQANLLKVKELFPALSIGLDFTHNISKKNSEAKFHVLELDLDNKKINGYSTITFEKASEKYKELEEKVFKNKGSQVVLVSADKIKEVKKVYQNFFLDTKDFLKELSKIEEMVNKNNV